MRVTGIIAEYNPLHNGHAYHIREAKARTGCDYLIVAMSGDFVQRGTPALMDRYVRAEAALLAGADMVVQLPTYSATASAESFAKGGIRLFRSLGNVTHLSYGVEVPAGCTLEETHVHLRKLAAYLAEEPTEYRGLLREQLSKGQSMPTARAAALKTLLPESVAFAETPNNILAIEYEKQCLLQGSSPETVPIGRTDAGYHSEIVSTLCSATAIRKKALQDGAFPYEAVPDAVHELYATSAGALMTADDFSDALFSILHGMRAEDIADISDISPDLARRIYKASRAPFTYTSLGDALKERSHTRTHVDRALCHILLGVTKALTEAYETMPALPYLQVLGMKQTATPLLRTITDNSDTPLLLRMATDVRKLSPEATALYQTEERASALYSQGLYRRGGILRSDYQRRFMMLP